ncbi:MAG: ATP-dependent Clp protease proteolytic subunit [Schwartzia sp.]|nr:ATP-dependent Clp protease proteolytic subunit [Schwartzia sp. (in: firmicutes)]
MPENFWKFKDDGGTPELMLYGEISNTSWDEDELTPALFAKDLAKMNGRDLTVHINSPGGDVFAAQAIYSQLKAYPGKVTMMIDGIAASAATVVASAGDKVIMPSNTIYMIHDPKTILFGFYDTARLGQMQERLAAVKQTIVNVYKGRVQDRMSEEEIRAKMGAETWMTAQTAKEYGFIDEITDEIPVLNRVEEGMLIVNSVSCKLDRFQNAEGLKAILDNRKEECDHLMDATDKLKSIASILGLTDKEEPKGRAEEDAAKAAVEAERQRVDALDALKNGNPVVDSIIETGKKNGATAEGLKPYINALPEEKAPQQDKAIAAIRDILKDNSDSGAANVLPTPQAASKDEAASREANIGDIVNFANQIRGVK